MDTQDQLVVDADIEADIEAGEVAHGHTAGEATDDARGQREQGDAVGKHDAKAARARARKPQQAKQQAQQPERARHHRAPRWLRITGTVLLAALAAVLVLGAVVVNVQHWKLEPVLSGSMRPGIQPGDLAIVRPVPADDLEVGDVIAYLPPGHQVPVLHRIVSLNDQGLVTQGDANNVTDPWGRVKPQGSSVERLMTVIPKVGFVLDVRSMLLKIVGVIFVVAVAVWIWAMIHDRKKGAGGDEADGDDGAAGHDGYDDVPGKGADPDGEVASGAGAGALSGGELGSGGRGDSRDEREAGDGVSAGPEGVASGGGELAEREAGVEPESDGSERSPDKTNPDSEREGAT